MSRAGDRGFPREQALANPLHVRVGFDFFSQLICFVLIPIFAGTFAILLSNRHAGRGWTLSPGGHMFVLGRLVASGMAGPYLRQECKVEPLISCRYLDSLPSDETKFLWGDNPLFDAMGRWTGSNAEATKIIVGTIRHSPGRFLWECIKQMFRQVVAMKTTIGISGPYPPYLLQAFQTFYPQDIPKCVVSKQWTGGLLKLANRVSNLNLAVFWCSMACCVVCFASRFHHADAASRLFLFVLISLFSNALVTASLSMLADRFQSRVSWLMAVCCMAYVVSMLRRREYRSADDRRSQSARLDLETADSAGQKTT